MSTMVYLLNLKNEKRKFLLTKKSSMKNYIMAFVLFFGVHTIWAQNDSVQNESAPSENLQNEGGEITDDELEKYAVTMDSVNDMKASLLEDITEMVKGNGKMTA